MIVAPFNNGVVDGISVYLEKIFAKELNVEKVVNVVRDHDRQGAVSVVVGGPVHASHVDTRKEEIGLFFAWQSNEDSIYALSPLERFEASCSSAFDVYAVFEGAVAYEGSLGHLGRGVPVDWLASIR